MAFVLRLEAGVRVTEAAAAVAVRLKLDGFERMATELCGLVWAVVVLVGFVFERVVVRLRKGATAGLGDLWTWATAVELSSDSGTWGQLECVARWRPCAEDLWVDSAVERLVRV